MRKVLLLAAALCRAVPVMAEEAPRPLLDVSKPIVLKRGAPWCLSYEELDTFVKLAAQGAEDLAAELPGCLTLKSDVRAYIMETRGWFVPAYRLRWRMPSGRHWEGWTLSGGLRNGDPAPTP